MIDATATPQIIEHCCKSLTVTSYDTRWIPCTAKFVSLGCYVRGTGCLQVFELDGLDLKAAVEVEKVEGFKCGTFAAAGTAEHVLATGGFAGSLQIWDLEDTTAPVFQAAAHSLAINQIDGCGGQGCGGPPELASCSRDGAVRVWDTRQPGSAVAAFEPQPGAAARDCWTVAFGNSYNDAERCVLAGYDNGDIKMFDLRTNRVRWEANVGNGVCSVQFDRKDIPMNKFVAACLESHVHAFDARTQHPDSGFASVEEKSSQGSTLWHCAHLPQNRDVCAVTGGNGSVALYQYSYPDQRSIKDGKGMKKGVAGTLRLLGDRCLSTQPIAGFDWSPDKQGLFCCAALDQCVRAGMVTKLDTL